MSLERAWISALAIIFCVSVHADSSYTFTILNDRGAGGGASAINDAGQIAGNSSFGGFVYSNGIFSYPNLGGEFSAGGINNFGVISGTLTVGANDMGVISNGSNTTTFSVPGSVRTLADDINDSGVVVGYYTTSGPNSPAIYTYDGAHFATLTLPPDATYAFPTSINDAGQIVGEYVTSTSFSVQFFYDGMEFHPITCPDSSQPVLTGLSNSGIVFGWCIVPGSSLNSYSISYFSYKDGVYSTINAPGPITGMNKSGEIVGTIERFADPSSNGFIGTPVALRFVPVSPCRVADTRLVNGPFGGPELAGGTERDFAIPNSACEIPANAAAYALNVAVVPVSELGFLSVWPAGQARPLVSTLNSDGRVKANAAVVPAGTNGGVAVYVSNASNVILDISGYFVAGDSAALSFYPVTPCRIADTRFSTGALGAPSLSGGVARSFPVLSGPCNIPAAAQAYSLNLTAIPHSELGFLSAWAAGQAQPLVSTLNSDTGAITANAAIVPAGTSGAINLFASNDSDVVIDVNGYFAPPAPGGLSLYTVTPCRLLDTRTGSGAFAGTVDVSVYPTACIPPSTAQAVVLNASVVPPLALSYLTLWPAGQSQPFVSTLNAQDGAITSNMAIVPAPTGSLSVYSPQHTQLILDLSGYFAP